MKDVVTWPEALGHVGHRPVLLDQQVPQRRLDGSRRGDRLSIGIRCVPSRIMMRPLGAQQGAEVAREGVVDGGLHVAVKVQRARR